MKTFGSMEYLWLYLQSLQKKQGMAVGKADRRFGC